MERGSPTLVCDAATSRFLLRAWCSMIFKGSGERWTPVDCDAQMESNRVTNVQRVEAAETRVWCGEAEQTEMQKFTLSYPNNATEILYSFDIFNHKQN